MSAYSNPYDGAYVSYIRTPVLHIVSTSGGNKNTFFYINSLEGANSEDKVPILGSLKGLIASGLIYQNYIFTNTEKVVQFDGSINIIIDKIYSNNGELSIFFEQGCNPISFLDSLEDVLDGESKYSSISISYIPTLIPGYGEEDFDFESAKSEFENDIHESASKSFTTTNISCHIGPSILPVNETEGAMIIYNEDGSVSRIG